MISEDYVCQRLIVVLIRAHGHLLVAVNHSLAVAGDDYFELVRLSDAIKLIEVERLLELCEYFFETCRYFNSLIL